MVFIELHKLVGYLLKVNLLNSGMGSINFSCGCVKSHQFFVAKVPKSLILEWQVFCIRFSVATL